MLRQLGVDPNVPAAVRTAFGTGNIALILASITHGLLRTAALEERLNRRAAGDEDLGASHTAAATQPKPHAAQPASVRPTAQAETPDLARRPTAKEIAADVGRPP